MISQAMHPAGLQGWLFGRAMEWLHTPAYRRAVALIEPVPGDTVLEIGFGTGALFSMLAPRLSGGLLAGVDPSALMVRQARGRLRPFEKEVRLELRQGTDRDIEWPAASFTHVAALHSFQFWSEPAATLRHISNVLRPGGQLILILRSHSRRRPEWLPNALSRSADEIAGTLAALGTVGFHRVVQHADAGSSAVITARLPKSDV